MKDNTVARIDHSKCTHPDTSHEKAKCRARKISATVPTPVVVAGARKPKPLAMDAHALRGIADSLDQIEQEAQTWASLESAVVVLLVDDSEITATYKQGSWQVRLG